MILEVAILDVRPGHAKRFEAAFEIHKDCAIADDGALLMPMVNLEVEAHK